MDLLLPATDAGVFAQLAVLIFAASGILYLVRRNRDLMLLAGGIAVLALSLMALRAVH